MEEKVKPDQVLVIHECVRGAHTGEMTFPQIVGKLAQIGVERYHADYTRREKTHYFVGGASVVAAMPQEGQTIGEGFSAEAVEAAVRQSQRGEHTYADFVKKTMAAGCVGYFVQITGRRALYFGRRGEIHEERFPSAPPSEK